MYLRSFWNTARAAPATMAIAATQDRTDNNVPQEADNPEKDLPKTVKNILRMPKTPIFITSADRIALTGEGAIEWASGSQPWSGKSAALTVNPTTKNASATAATGRYVDRMDPSRAEISGMLRLPVTL